MREFRELLEKDVAERIRKAKARNAEKLQEHEDKLQSKVDKERESLDGHYKGLRDQYEKAERQRQEVELARFRREQQKQLDNKRGDIEKLRQEKARIKAEFDESVRRLMRDATQKLEADKRELDQDFEE